jgi:AcrR family transcriptional regulator
MIAPQRLPTAQRRQQIAEAALRILSDQGVHRLTAAALAGQVGIADGTIFRHFSNKEEIVDAAIDLFKEAMGGTFPPEEGDPLSRLGLFFVNRLALVSKHPEILRLAFNDRLAEAAGEAGAERVSLLVKRSVAFVHECLVEAQARGEVTRDTPAEMLTWMVVGVIRGSSTGEQGRTPGKGHHPGTSPEHAGKELEKFLRSSTKGANQ